MSTADFVPGWRRDAEDRDYLAASARPYATPARKQTPLKSFSARGIIRTEQQRRRNSCVGHGLSSCGEACAYLDSGGKLKLQFSRWGCYIWAQQAGGLAGRDQGATITGAIKAAQDKGFPPEEIWPYPADSERYSTREPAGAAAAARPFRALKQSPIRSYQDALDWMQQGLGPLLLGIDWTNGLANNRGEITLADIRGGSLGGHCVFIWGWDADGLLDLGNSHGPEWGENGWRKTRPEVVDTWTARGDVYGLSDLESIDEPREVVPDIGEGM